MSDLYSNPDPDFAVATLGRALRELLATLNSAAPEHDAYGGEHASWRLMLRPAADDQDDVPAPVPSPVAAPAVAPAVAVSVDAGSTHPRSQCRLRGKDRPLSNWRPRRPPAGPSPCGTTTACRTAAAAFYHAPLGRRLATAFPVSDFASPRPFPSTSCPRSQRRSAV
ncbi:hypothetical protein ABT144_11265 [Streptomyces sp. NPDC002039]|uniref:hypothetical protein n=1 Tax=Streptomyces sp. NPDC002039 TaxID=3154660 RepID=UPI0033265BAF